MEQILKDLECPELRELLALEKQTADLEDRRLALKRSGVEERFLEKVLVPQRTHVGRAVGQVCREFNRRIR